MLKLTILTVTNSRHAETDYVDTTNSRQDVLKLIILTVTNSRHAETDYFDHDKFKTC
jgi:hypothetical protein